MSMAADSNMSFHNGVFPSSFCNQVVVSFQSGAVNGTAGVVQGGINNSGGISSSSGMVRAGNPSSILSNTSSMMLQGNSQSSLFLEPMAGLKHDTGLAVDWSYKEQAILHHGLIKYADQPSILKYIKIAALLPEKTVRDVALRCRWMSRKESDKRRKLEEFYAGKKLKDRKVSCISDRQKTSKLGRIRNLLQSVLAEVLCLHRGVVKKEVAVLCRRKEEGSLPSPRSGEKGSVAVLCRRKEEGSLPSPRSDEKGSVAVLCRRKEEGSLPSPRSGEKGSVAILCRRKEEGFSAITV
ncbi:hypothetical protein M5K25_016271 [Dendrobium thyrsiflorum]|uniref:Uncharacterized protein n=1 Tax=Dendrobium thyrsiflorum TaxID=117978 RepID=A0ABD0UJ65_DENTH